MRFSALGVVLVLVAAPLASLPARPDCCAMAGSGMACCAGGGMSGDGTCQLRSCAPAGSAATLAVPGGILPSVIGFPRPVRVTRVERLAASLALIDPSAPPTPPPRG